MISGHTFLNARKSLNGLWSYWKLCHFDVIEMNQILFGMNENLDEQINKCVKFDNKIPSRFWLIGLLFWLIRYETVISYNIKIKQNIYFVTTTTSTISRYLMRKSRDPAKSFMQQRSFVYLQMSNHVTPVRSSVASLINWKLWRISLFLVNCYRSACIPILCSVVNFACIVGLWKIDLLNIVNIIKSPIILPDCMSAYLIMTDNKLFNRIQSHSLCLSHLLPPEKEDIALYILYPFAKITSLKDLLPSDAYFIFYGQCVLLE